ncbi:MAG: hypothetical protein AAFZ65_15345, partial [Planctomycetota bacterium]
RSTGPARPWRRRWLWLCLPALPMLLLSGGSLVSGAGAVEACAPWMGPYAGVLLGHWDCTMANVMPWRSLTAGALGVVSIGLLLFGSDTRWAAITGAVAWIAFCLWWTVLALLSLINASS